MIRKMLLTLSLLMGVVFATAPLASAQSDVDIEQVSETVLGADTEALLAALETPMADEELPAGFSAAEFVDPAQATGQEGVIPSSDLEGTVGSVAYLINYEPSASATPDGEASPEAGMGAFSFGMGSLNYVAFEDELDSGDLQDFKDGAEEGIAGSATPEAGTNQTATVEDITVNDTDAVLLTYVIEEDGVQSVVQMIAVPVGSVMVMSMVVYASETVDADMLRTDAENLVLSGIDHLGTVAGGA
jgi:hypothetical protein